MRDLYEYIDFRIGDMILRFREERYIESLNEIIKVILVKRFKDVFWGFYCL